LATCSAAEGADEARCEQTTADAQFVHPNGQPKSVPNLVTPLLLEITGYRAFEATLEFQQWNRAKDFRNSIVHGGRLEVSAGEAKRAIDAIFAAVAHLQASASLVL